MQRMFPSIIPNLVNVEEEFSMSRSSRQGALLEAWKAGISEDVINMNN